MIGFDGVFVNYFFELDLLMEVYSGRLVGVGRFDLFLVTLDTLNPFSLLDLRFYFP